MVMALVDGCRQWVCVCVCGSVCNGEVTSGRAPEPVLCTVVGMQGFAESLQHSSSPQC